MELRSYAKINLSLDILGRREDGYHNISSLMQGIGLYDVIKTEKCSQSGTKYNYTHCAICGIDVYLCTDVETIPLNDDNLAIKGAEAVLNRLAKDGLLGGTGFAELSIFIEKKLPVAAGIAGGSGNAAVTMHAVNALAGYPYSLRELMEIGAAVGADVPFSLMMNARKNAEILAELPGLEEASTAAWMSGIGDKVEPTEPIERYVILANPGISVSTREAYEAMDSLSDYSANSGIFCNQMEKYTLGNYPEAAELKSFMVAKLGAECVLMSGSGPTMAAYYTDAQAAEADFRRLTTDEGFRERWRAWLTETGRN